MAKAWNIHEAITSPTFNIYHLFRGDRTLAHMDAYRLDPATEIWEELMLDELLRSSGYKTGSGIFRLFAAKARRMPCQKNLIHCNPLLPISSRRRVAVMPLIERLCSASIQSMPFTRPPLDQLLQGVDYALENDYPARGELAKSR